MSLLQEKLSLRARLLKLVGRQTWLPKGQDRLLRLIWPPDAKKSQEFEVDFFGKRYRGNLNHYIDWMVFCYGAAPHCELALLDHMANRIRAVRGHVNFFDVGANVGHHTLFMADRADHVFAFEPLPRLQGLIADKIALNGLTNVQILPIGLGNQSGWFDYYPGIGANSGIGTFTTPNSADFGASVKLTVERGDDVIKKMGLPRVDLIKIDVEGFERRVLEGLSRTIQRDRPAILMELSGHSRNEFGDVSQLLNCLYDDAKIAQVNGRAGKGYVLSQFQYETSEEIIVVPGEFHGFVE